MVKCCGQETYGDQRPRGDRRLQLIDEIKRLIGDIGDGEKGERGRPRDGGRRVGGAGGTAVRDMEEECRQYRKRRDCTPPTITYLGIHETRPTSDYSNMQYESTRQVTYVDATRGGAGEWNPAPPAPWELPRKPSQELRASTLYQSCDCTKRNGLQHDCPRWDCSGRPECVAINPGPCCGPSQARKPTRGDRRNQSVETSTPPLPPSREMAIQERPDFTAVPSPPGRDLQAIGIVTLTLPVSGLGVTPERLPTPGVTQNPVGITPSGTNYICYCKPVGPITRTVP